MNVPLLDIKAQLATIERELKDAINDVIDSGRYIGGAMVDECERSIAKYVSAEFAIGVSSGTDALLVSLMALGVGAGDIVITTDYSFFATAGVIARLGATPAFVDIDKNTYNISPQALAQWFNDNEDKIADVKAIIPVHLYGQCADMDAIMQIADEFGIPVIEDSAQAIGAKYPSSVGVKCAGSIGKAACFSFFPSKNLGAIGDAGMVTTNDEQLANKIRTLRNHGEESSYCHTEVGGNFRLDAIQAAAIITKLPHLEKWHAMRRDNAQYYDENLNVPDVKKPICVYGREFHIYNQYVISVPERRDELQKFLLSNGIGCKVYYPIPFHRQPCFAHYRHFSHNFVNSEHAAKTTLAIPIYPELSRQMQDYVIEKITEFYA